MNLILINIKKVLFIIKINKLKNFVMKFFILISMKKKIGRWFGVVFLKDFRGDMVLNKDGKINN